MDFKKMFSSIQKSVGKNVSLRDLAGMFAAGMAGYPDPTLELEAQLFREIAVELKKQINAIKNDELLLQDQQRKIKRARRYKSLRKLREMDPKDFEYWTAGFFIEQKYRNVIVVPPGPDYGVDIYMAAPNLRKVIVQCKRYKSKVSRPVVQQTLGVMYAMKASACFIVTPGEFTQDAIAFSKEFMAGKKITLFGGSDITKR